MLELKLREELEKEATKRKVMGIKAQEIAEVLKRTAGWDGPIQEEYSPKKKVGKFIVHGLEGKWIKVTYDLDKREYGIEVFGMDKIQLRGDEMEYVFQYTEHQQH